MLAHASATLPANESVHRPSSTSPIDHPSDVVDARVLDALPPGSEIISVTPSGRKSVVGTARIDCRLPDGSIKSYFQKSATGEQAVRIMRGSFESEMTFYSFCPDHVPKPIAWGNYESDTTTWFYLCDFHDMIDDLPGPDDLVPVIADVQTARVAKPSNNNFNFLADIHNDDKWQVSWELQFTQAMRRMFSHEEQLRGKDDRLTELREDLFEKVIPRLLRPLETSGHSLQPCLIHSDLCPSSVMVDEDTSKVMIFDSCAYWSHNEAELGTWRSTQNKSGPPYSSEYIVKMGISEPVEDWDDRNALYALRYILLLSTMYPDDPKFRTMAMWEMQRLVDKFPMGYEGNQFVSP